MLQTYISTVLPLLTTLALSAKPSFQPSKLPLPPSSNPSNNIKYFIQFHPVFRCSILSSQSCQQWQLDADELELNAEWARLERVKGWRLFTLPCTVLSHIISLFKHLILWKHWNEIRIVQNAILNLIIRIPGIISLTTFRKLSIAFKI